ncbi:g459 [Coccomyxa viridis]|uniref:Vacuolar protein sorting-associated protein 35 n=1 Tax=Coccomyxa viridis TaxID=1274662 RepID=A0ABP1FKZ2_9CHLO
MNPTMEEDRPMTHQESQAKWLQDASNLVKRNAFFMKRALDDDNLREALRFSAAMLGELRTSLLTPQKYFELYMQAFDELRHLEIFFKEEHSKGRSYADLYELVQHAGNVLPRLYLLCTVGSCFIRSKEAHAKDILKDLVEMCKGVQHPTRGLFLRSYLCQVSRGLLPDTGSEYEGDGGNINDALEFLLLNFTEMNKLWVRMQHQGSGKDRDRKEGERQQLADLVGKNLTYISQLEGLDFKLYKDVVQGRMMEQVVSCKDEIAQQYLMQCIIQGFPDEFHLGTLTILLSSLPELQSGVKIHLIVASLLDRLNRFAASDAAVVNQFNDVDAFGQFLGAAARISEQHESMHAADIASMYIALTKFVGAVYPDHLDYVDRVLQSCCAALKDHSTLQDDRTEKQIVALLTSLLTAHEPVTVLGLSTYPEVMGLLKADAQKSMAVKIVETILKVSTEISEPAQVETLLDFVKALITDIPGVEVDEEDFQEEQDLVARLIHRLRSPDPGQQFAVLRTAWERLSVGGPRRLRHTIPPIAFAALHIARKEAATGSGQPSAQEVLQFVHRCAAQLGDAGESAEMALQLFLTAAYSASEHAKSELIAYEFFEQAFVLFEESIPDSAAERTALSSIVGALHGCRVFSPDSRSTLVHKATGYSAKLLRKADQCRAVLACSHLHWQDNHTEGDQGWNTDDAVAHNGDSAASQDSHEDSSSASPVQPPVRDGDQVMVCLKRALKIAHAAQQQLAIALRQSDTLPAALFVEILNHYLYYFDQGLALISSTVLQNLLELVANEMANDNCQKDASLMAFYNATLSHISSQKALPDKASLYDDIQI